MDRDRAFRLMAFTVTMAAVCSVVYTPAARSGGTGESHPRNGAVRHRRSAVLSAAVRGVLERRGEPGPVPVVPPPHLRGVGRVDDGQRLARPGVARRVPARGAPDVDRRRLRGAAAAGRHRQGAAEPVRVARGVRVRLQHRLDDGPAVAPGIARRWLLLALSHAEQLRGQRAAARRHRRSPVRPGARAAVGGLQSHVGRRHRDRVRAVRAPVPQHGVGEGRRLLRHLPQHRRHARHAVPHARARRLAGRARIRPGARHGVARAARAGTPGHLRRARCERAEPRLRRRRRELSPLAARDRFPRPVRTAHGRTHRQRATPTSRASSARRCRTSRWTRASTTAITTCS